MIAANDHEEAPDAPALDLMAYLDGELSEEQAVAVEAKLARDPRYAAELRRLTALGDFLRDDADRLYAGANVDGIVDDVLAKLPRTSVLPASSMPLSSVATRRRKNSVIWVAFGSVAAAAAALFFYVRAHEPPQTTAQGPKSGESAQTVAVNAGVKSTAASPSKNPDVSDLEVGEGATVIYTAESAPVVWITRKSE